MKIEEFYSYEQLSLLNFLNYWHTGNLENSEMFPVEMNHGDWEEQLDFYKKRRDERINIYKGNDDNKMEGNL